MIVFWNSQWVGFSKALCVGPIKILLALNGCKKMLFWKKSTSESLKLYFRMTVHLILRCIVENQNAMATWHKVLELYEVSQSVQVVQSCQKGNIFPVGFVTEDAVAS